jgi:competence protein ComGC
MRAASMRARAEGFALIDVVFVCGMIGILCLIALPRLLTAKQAASASSAIGSMRTINSAQLTFALTCGGGFYAPNLTTLGTAPPGSNEAFIGGGLGTANTVTKAGYIVRLAAVAYPGSPPSCNGLAGSAAGQGFAAAADPAEPTNIRFFATNATNQIYEDKASLFASMPEAGEPASGHLIR